MAVGYQPLSPELTGNFFGGAGTAGGSMDPFTGVGVAPGSSRSTQYFNDPALVGQLSKALGGNAVNASNMFMDFIKDPASSQLFLKQLTGLLNSPQLQASRQQAQQGLTDQFRAAGNMSSGAFGNAAARQQGDFNAQDQTLAAQLLGQVFQQMTGALAGQQGLGAQLANILKMGSSASQSYAPQSGSSSSGSTSANKFPSLGGSAPMGGGMATNSSYPGGPMTSWAAQDQAYVQQQNAANQAIIDAFQNQYGNMGSTYLGANGEYVSGAPGGQTPWDPTAYQSGGGQYSYQQAQPWNFANDTGGQQGGPAADWSSLYGNADGSLEY